MKTAKKNIQTIDTSTEVSPEERAFLVHGTKKVPIRTEVASRHSLFFRYLEKHEFESQAQSVYLMIRNRDQNVELGPCRILSGPDLNGYHGRLVFLQDVYDVHSLLEKQKVINLQSAFKDLPDFFERKEKIEPRFKSYVADLKYDLQIYKNLFDELDSQFQDEPVEVKDIVQKAIFDSEGKKFLQYYYNKIVELGQIVDSYSQEEHQAHAFYFRKQLWEFIISCPLLTRTNIKPRGFAGDSEMMRMVYRNGYEGQSTFGKLLHKYTVGIVTGDSVRYRRYLIPKMLRDTQKTASQITRVLSVACGPASEMSDILATTDEFEKYQFCLLDQDQIALDEASEMIAELEKKMNATTQVQYVNKSVRWMFGKKTFEQDLGRFHFIYSMGLFDYLVSRVAKAVLNKLYELLLPGGEMVIGNFHVSNPDRYSMEYWADWFLILRKEKEFASLCDDKLIKEKSIIFDEAGIQMFLHIKKPQSGR
jgi:extracellular factor (EF) 3-hydroxypalmitic acid methyl ester biosynthesis protein